MVELYWKPLIAPILAAIAASLFTYWLTRANAPDVSVVQAELRWIDVESPFYGAAPGFGKNFEMFFQNPADAASFATAIDELRVDKDLRITALTLTNNSKVRTEAVEASVDGEGLMYSALMEGDRVIVSAHIKLKPIDPGSKSVVYIVAPRWSQSSDNVHVLQGDKKVEVSDREVPEGLVAVVYALESYPFLIFALEFIALACLCIVVTAVVVALYQESTMERRARATTPEQVRKWIAVLDYIKEKHPEKLPPAPAA